MFKTIIVISLGYVLYKVVKNGAFLAIENIFKNKKLDEPTDLVQCSQCKNYISRDLVKKHKKMDFCSDECINEFRDSN
jgi:hypothetical protein